MKIKKSKLKSIILEELEFYNFHKEMFSLVFEVLTPAQLAHINKLQADYEEKIKDRPPSFRIPIMAPSPLGMDIPNKFRWVAYEFLQGVKPENMPEEHMEDYATVMKKIGSEKFKENLMKFAGTMLYNRDWKKYYPFKDKPQDEIAEYLLKFTQEVYDKFEEMEKEREERYK